MRRMSMHRKGKEMNKAARLISILFSLCVLVGTLAGCSTKGTYFSVMNEGIKAINSYNFDTEILIQTKKSEVAADDSNSLVAAQAKTDTTISLVLWGTVLETGALWLNVDMGYQQVDGAELPMAEISDVILVDDRMFINVKKLTALLGTLTDASTSETERMMADYIEVPADTLNTAIGSTTEMCKAMNEGGKLLSAKVLTLFDTLFTEKGQVVLDNQRDTYEISVNKENAEVVLDILIGVFADMPAIIDSCIEELSMKDSGGKAYTSVVDGLVALKDKLTGEKGEELTDCVVKLKDCLADLSSFSITGKASLMGAVGERICSYDIQCGIEDMVGVYFTDTDISGVTVSCRQTLTEVPYTTVIDIPQQVVTDFDTGLFEGEWDIGDFSFSDMLEPEMFEIFE